MSARTARPIALGLALAVAFALPATPRVPGELITAAELQGPLLIESLAAIPGGLLVSSVHGRTIFELDRSGLPRRWLTDPQVLGVFGMAVDQERGVLWAASTGAPQVMAVSKAERHVSELLKIDLSSHKVLARYAAPDAGEAPRLGDVAVGPDGTVYVSNPLGAAVYRLKPGAAALETLVSGAPLKSPQGMVVSPDNRLLVVANYGTGLHRIDLATSEMTAIDGGEILGVDGLTRHDDGAIAIRNGGRPRVVRLAFNPGWTRVTEVVELASGHPDLDQPTMGIVREGLFVFISRSQWSAFADSGERKADVGPARISILRLSGKAAK